MNCILTPSQAVKFLEQKRKIKEDLSQVPLKTILWKGYRVFQENHTICKKITLTTSYVALATLLVFSSTVSAYGSVKAYLEFQEEGGFSNQGGSIGGHFAEWWPRSIYYLTSAVGLPVYVFYHLGRCKIIDEIASKVISDESDSVLQQFLKDYTDDISKNNRFDLLPFNKNKDEPINAIEKV